MDTQTAHCASTPGSLKLPFTSSPHKRALSDLCRYLMTLASNEIATTELSRSALVFSPHPDDESLGCGGTIIKKKQVGATVNLVHMTDGSGSHRGVISALELREIRARESVNAARVLGVDHTYFLDFEDTRLTENVGRATERVVEILRKEKPEEVFVPHRLEPMRQAADHVATTAIVLAALDEYRTRVTVWEYPVWFWLHWPWVGLRPQCPPIKARHIARNTLHSSFGLRAFKELRRYVDIADVVGQKRAALAEHKSQMTKLMPDWSTLNQVSRGQFLDCFYYRREFFRLSVIG
jgi:LmbE family N-acetylglucosaminyl deacetylase